MHWFQAQKFPVMTHYVTAPFDIRRDRVHSRNARKGDTFSFEITPAMFDLMEMQFEPPAGIESSACVVFVRQ